MATSTATTTSTTTGGNPVTAEPTILTRVFAVDRITVSASAAVLTLGAIPISGLLEWPTWIVLTIGLAFIPYGWMLHTIVRDRAHHSAAARFSAVGDALWVVASAATIVVAADVTSTVGAWIIAAQALMVADIGLFKVIGWWRS